jgi:LemA protein
MNSIWMIAGMFGLFAMWMAGIDPRWILACGLALVAWSFNTVISARNQLEKAFASISVMLQKRHDLIPNLVAAVQRYLEHESDVLERVTALRARATSPSVSPAEQAKVEGEIGQVLRQIVATAESYPELKASENFQQLQRSLNETEEQLSAARRAYNASVQHYDDHRRMFPANLIALVLGYDQHPYFEIKDASVAERPDVAAQFRASGRK